MSITKNSIMFYLRSFLYELRALDDRAKKIWVFVLSGISMTLISIIWVFYINITIADVPPSQLEQEQISKMSQNEAGKKSENYLIANFKRNTSLIYNNLLNKILGIKNSGKEIIIVK